MAQIQIPALPSNSGVNDGDLLHIRQGGTDVKMTRAALLAAFVKNVDLTALIQAEVEVQMNARFRGSIYASIRDLAPQGYLKCNGQSVSVATYQALFDLANSLGLVGPTKFFVWTSPSATFKMPDLRGKFIRGFDDIGTVDVDRSGASVNFASTQLDALKSHSHTINSVTRVNSWDNKPFEEVNGGGSSAKSGIIGNTGGSETRPVNVALNYFIKF